MPVRAFSIKMDKVKAKRMAKRHVKKYKLKTSKAAQKRFNVVGGLRVRDFLYKAVGHRHLNRNKSRINLQRAKRRHLLKSAGDARHMKRLLPYFKKRRALRC